MNKRIVRFGLVTLLAASLGVGIWLVVNHRSDDTSAPGRESAERSLPVAHAPSPANVPRIGYLSAGSPGEREEAFRQRLRELGYVEGKNIVIEYRYGEGKSIRSPGNAAELVGLNVDVIVTGGSLDTHAAKEATTTIPIVMTNEGDPVETGSVASLARPGRNVTGVTSLSSELIGKRLELLKEVLPQLSHVFLLRGPGIGISALSLKHAQGAAQSLGLKLQFEEAPEPHNFDRAFDAITKARTGALTVIAGPFSTAERKRLVEFAASRRLPAIYYRPEFVEEGGLMSYHANSKDLARRAAVYVDKILKGAKPADLPVEQPNTFELFINLNAAKEIGVTIPPSVQNKADKIIPIKP